MIDPTSVVLTGATGRMGAELRSAAADRDDVAVAGLVTRSPPAVDADGVAVGRPGDLSELLAATDPDALVEFTAPAAAVDHVETAAAAAVPAVVGTTGFDDPRAALSDAADAAPVLWASNFSRGVAALRRAVRSAAAALPDADVEITETHHAGKRDAPSGTARSLVADVETVRGDEARRVHGREGETPRQAGAIGVHARRGGGVAGEHEVLLAAERESLSLTHRAGERAVFADGALDAATWLADRSPGWYAFDDVLGDGTDAGDRGGTAVDAPPAEGER